MTTYDLQPNISKSKGPVTAGDSGDRQRDRILIGRLSETGPRRELWLDITGEQVVGVLGKRGTGKSYTLGVMIEGLAAGQGSSPIAVHTTPRGGLVFDIMDIFWSTQILLSGEGTDEIKKQHDAMKKGGMKTQELNVDVWLPAGSENPEIDPEGLQQLRIDPSSLSIDDWGALFDVNIYTEPRGMLIADLIHHVGVSGYTDNDGNEVPAGSEFTLQDLLRCLENAEFIGINYADATVRSVRQRLQSFAQLALFQGEPTPLTELIRPGRISIVMLARVPDALKTVLVSVLLNQVMRERRTASYAQKRLDLQPGMSDEEETRLKSVIENRIPRAWILMDEAHVLAGATDGSVARDALIKYAKEGRNIGLSLAVATQQPSALDSRLMSQVETMIVHQLTSSKDAAVASENMKSPAPEAVKIDGNESDVGALLRRLSQGEAVFSCGNAPKLPRLCVAEIRPRISAHGGYEA